MDPRPGAREAGGLLRRSFRVTLGEDRVELAPGLGEHLCGLLHLRGGAGGGDLPDRGHGLADHLLQVAAVVGLALLRERRPYGRHLVGVLGDVAPSGLREPQDLAAGVLPGREQALVLELLDRRVDRSGARPPRAVGALGDLLDHLVAVEVLLHVGVEHVEDGSAYVAPPGPLAGPLPRSAAPAEVAADPRHHALPEHLGHPRGRPARTTAEPTAGSTVTGTVPVVIAVSHLGTPFLSSRMWSGVRTQVSESLPMH